MADTAPCIWVLAGTNGAGKSSIAGALLRESGGEYFNPDEAARRIRDLYPALAPRAANAQAWALGVRQLDDAIRLRRDYFFETTLGGTTIARRLERAHDAGFELRVWYAGLRTPELHIARVASRVRAGGHDIPEADVRRRFESSRRNLVRLLPRLAELRVYDNSRDADPKRGKLPNPKLVLHWQEGAIVAPADLRGTPDWAKPIVARAIKLRIP